MHPSNLHFYELPIAKLKKVVATPPPPNITSYTTANPL
jgi:hypothetical protein